jgi:hypothetical protein
MEHEGIRFDRNAIGCVDHSFNEGAIWTLMRPSIFLAVATPLTVPRASLDWLVSQINAGQAIAPAELRFRVASGDPLALSHEGRHRMTALMSILENRHVPVRITLQGHCEEDITPSVVEKLRRRVRSQRGRSIVEGPLFGETEIDLGGLPLSGVPPPLSSEIEGGFGFISRHCIWRHDVID